MKKLIRFDWAIKYLLRNKANFDVLEAFLSHLLKEKITIENLLESESNTDSEQGKFNRVDLKCLDSKGRHIIIEVQTQRETDYIHRILWGTSKALVESLELGSKYVNIVKVISVSILYHKQSTPENTDFIYYGTTELIGVHTKKPLIVHNLESADKSAEKSPPQTIGPITSRSIFPEYYLIYVEKFQDIINEDIDEWIYFFKHQEIKENFKSRGIRLLAEKFNRLTMPEKDRRAYEHYVDYLVRDLSVLDAAKEDGLREGRQEGLKQGLKEGLEKGLEQGIEQGREQGMIILIQNMLKNGMTVEQAAKTTGLSIETVQHFSTIKMEGK